MGAQHDDAVRQSFTQQAAAFESDRFIGRLVTDGEWVLQRLELHPEQLALDVAAGTGHAARGLAPHVRSVVVTDATPAMLEAGARAASAAGLANLVFLTADAYALPFLDGAFDVVVCRFAAHHFQDPAAVFGELLRCTRPGGQVLVADLVADADPAVAAAQDALEVLRDPSHAACLTVAELQRHFAQAGARSVRTDLHRTERPLAPWLAQTDTPPAAAAAITAALHAETRGGAPTGLHPQLRDGELWFEQRFAAVTGRAA